MIITLRIPTRAQYSYAEVSIAPADKEDAIKKLSEVDEELAEAIAAAVDQACAIANVKTGLGATIVKDEGQAKPWQRKTVAAPPANLDDLFS